MRLFVTVGTQLPFDRLVTFVDAWIGCQEGVTGFAQVGPTGERPLRMTSACFLEAAEFVAQVKACSAIVAHAGVGSILTALHHGKPLLVMPRRRAFGEHRNDHQVATARRFTGLPGISVAHDETDLPAALARLRDAGPTTAISEFAPPPLLDAIRGFIHAQ